MSFSRENRVFPGHVNLKRLNAIFLKYFVFKDRGIVVHTGYPRYSIHPNSIIVDSPQTTFTMMGMDFYGHSNRVRKEDVAEKGTPWIAYGLSARGMVDVQVLAGDPGIRDDILSETLAGYISYEGRCWFVNNPDSRIHGYTVRSHTESELGENMDGAQRLYVANLSLEFWFDVTTAKMLKHIEHIVEYPIIVIE